MATKWLKMHARGRSKATIEEKPPPAASFTGGSFTKEYSGPVCYTNDLFLAPREGYYALLDGQINPKRPLNAVRDGETLRYYE